MELRSERVYRDARVPLPARGLRAFRGGSACGAIRCRRPAAPLHFAHYGAVKVSPVRAADPRLDAGINDVVPLEFFWNVMQPYDAVAASTD